MNIALKEARENYYWLKILDATESVSVNRTENLKDESEQLAKIIASLIISTKKNNKN